MLFSLLSLYFLLKALNENKTAFWGLYSFFTVVNNYNHFFALAILPAQGLITCIFFVDEWLKKRKAKLNTVNYRKYAYFAVCIVLILIMTLLLYLPTRNHLTATYFSRSTRNILSFRTDLRFSDVVTETYKRHLEYYTSLPLFYVKLLLILTGVIGCLKSRRKELALIFVYLTFPFLVFFYANPPPQGYLPADNKFIFMLPILLILLARGLVLIGSVFVDIVSRIVRIRKIATVRNFTFAFLVLIILLTEGFLLKDYHLQFWRLRSPERNGEINTILKDQIDKDIVVLFANSRSLNKLLFVSPIYYPGRIKKGFMIQEIGFLFLRRIVNERMGLWIILNQLELSGEDIEDINKLSGDIKIERRKQNSIIRLQDEDQASLEKLKMASDMLPLLPITREERIANHLVLADFYLAADENEEALRELKVLGEMGLEVSSVQENENRIVTTILYDQISESLFESANKLFREGKTDEAISLQEKAIEFKPQNSEFHLALAESYEKTGRRDDATEAYKNALKLNSRPIISSRIIHKIRELQSLPNGYIIWFRDNTWHVRWWSQEKGIFSGDFVLSVPIKQVKGYRLNKNDTYAVRDSSVIFRAITRNGNIEGFDIIPNARAELQLDLAIDKRKDIENRIIRVD